VTEQETNAVGIEEILSLVDLDAKSFIEDLLPDKTTPLSEILLYWDHLSATRPPGIGPGYAGYKTYVATLLQCFLDFVEESDLSKWEREQTSTEFYISATSAIEHMDRFGKPPLEVLARWVARKSADGGENLLGLLDSLFWKDSSTARASAAEPSNPDWVRQIVDGLADTPSDQEIVLRVVALLSSGPPRFVNILKATLDAAEQSH
jgi:hypothetical protein